MPSSTDPHLSAGVFIDSDNQDVQHFSRDAVGLATDPVEKVRRLYYRVRDDIRYDPYVDFCDPASYRASAVLAQGSGFCIPKAALMAAGARALGIPARVGYADVRNHLATERLLQELGGNLFIFHGYAELWVDNHWVKATPCFNLSLCERFGVQALEFDGRNDAMLHPYDTRQRLHMEYVRQRGVYDDVPFDEIIAEMRVVYPRVFRDQGAQLHGDFAAEASAERDKAASSAR